MNQTPPQPSLIEFFSINDCSETSPVVVHAPHGSRFIPAHLEQTFLITPEHMTAEKDRMTDHFTDELVLELKRCSSIVNGLSRFVVDVERFPDEREEMLAVGMGAFYTQGSERQRIREDAETEHPKLREFFDAYSAQFTELVQRTLDQHGRAVIIDLHSYPTSALPYELHSDEPRPELDIGADSLHTPPSLIESVREAFSSLQSGVNESFHGTYVPLRFYDQRDERVQSVMLEVRRDTYMNEATVERSPDGFAQLSVSLQRLVDQLNDS
jgi:N-formylglutamate amidohydrolase